MPQNTETETLRDPHRQSIIEGALWMLSAALGFAVMIGIVNHLSTALHPFVIVFFRNLFGLAFMLPWLVHTRLGGLKTEHLGLHAIRAGFGMIAMLCWFWGVANMPMAEAVALNFTAPLFATILAAFILREIVRLRRWSATVVGFIGVIVVLRPDPSAFTEPAMVILLGSVFMAATVIFIKVLSRTESSSAIVTYMVLFLTPLSLIPALFVWSTPDWTSYVWLIALGAAATVSHQSMNRAFRAADASAIMPFDYVRLPFAAIIGFFFFGQLVDLWTWVGAGIIAAAGIYIAHREVVVGREPTAPLAAGHGVDADTLESREKG